MRTSVRMIWGAIAMLLVVLLTGCISPSHSIEGVTCSSTALNPGASGEDGMGGSGILASTGTSDGPSAAGQQAVDGEGDEDGVGGSGIYGTLTGFGSICVNGRRIPIGESVSITRDGEPTNPDALSVGQVLRIAAQDRPVGVVADSIAIEHEIIGPVTQIDESVIFVMGERVEVSSGATAPGLEVRNGLRVAVSGLRRSDGSIVASRVDAARAADPDLVRGVGRAAEWVAAKPAIGRVPLVFVSSAAADSSHPVGGSPDRSVVRGRWSTDRGALEIEKIVPSPLLGPAQNDVDIEGYVRAVSDDVVEIAGLKFDTDTGSTIRSGLRGLSVNDRVRIRATRMRGTEGVFRVTRFQQAPARVVRQILDGSDKVKHDNLESGPKAAAEAGGDVSSSGPSRNAAVGEPEARSENVRPERPERPDHAERPERPSGRPETLPETARGALQFDRVQ